MRYFVTMGKKTLEIDLGSDGITVDGDKVEAELVEVDGTEVRSLLLNGESHRVNATRREKGLWSLRLSGRHLTPRVLDERSKAIEEMTGGEEEYSGPKALKAPMPGLVVKIDVEEGEVVNTGQGLAIVEAMKMENELKSEGAARVRRVLVTPGQAVEKDQLMIEFDPLDNDDEDGGEG